MDTLRAFFAIAVEPTVASALYDLLKPWHVAAAQPSAQGKEPSAKGKELRWTKVENYHLTLAFLGDINLVDQEALEALAARCANNISDFDLHFDRIVYFPSSSRPRVLALLPGAEQSLQDLQSQLQEGLKSMGYRIEKGHFRPHLTVARVKSRRRPSLQLENLPAHLSTRISSLLLMRSELTAQGSHYSVLFSQSFNHLPSE